jgi:hypothetical protein
LPFYCDIGYEERMLVAALSEPAALSRWTVSAGMTLSPRDEIAVLSIAGKETRLHVRFRCLVDRIVAKQGGELHLGSALLRVIADGEEIPDDYRYCFLS